MSESGIYYLVSNEKGPGKRFVRKPPPPPTSPPLDDDFDIITQGASNNPPASRRHTQYTQAPLDDDFDAFTQDYTTTLGGGRVLTEHSPPMSEDPTPSWLDGTRHTDTYVAHPVPNSIRRSTPSAPGSKRHQSAHPRLRHTDRITISGRNGQPRKEGGSSGSNTWDLEPSRQVGKGKEAVRSLHRRAQSAGAAYSLNPQHARHGQGATARALHPHGSMDAPLPGPAFEIVKRRVIEDGPEKTVTISTWREKVAQEASMEVGMSVYYVNPDDYAVEEQDHQSRIVTEVKRSDSILGQPEHFLSGNPAQLPPITPHKTSGSRQQSDMLATKMSDSLRGTTSLNGIGILEPPSPRSSRSSYPLFTTSTPIKRSSSSPKRYCKGSSPVIHAHSTSPLRHTRSTSMSSNPEARPWTTSGAKNILASCEPSLLHVAPVLASLGITTETHLRAVARLSTDVRDRELKDEALRKGVTFMEWAILVDKLQSL